MNAVIRLEELNTILPQICPHCRAILEEELTVTSSSTVNGGGLDAMLQRFVHELGTTVECFRGHSRELMPARRQFCEMARRRGYTFVQIGAVMDRSHSAVLRICHAQ